MIHVQYHGHGICIYSSSTLKMSHRENKHGPRCWLKFDLQVVDFQKQRLPAGPYNNCKRPTFQIYPAHMGPTKTADGNFSKQNLHVRPYNICERTTCQNCRCRTKSESCGLLIFILFLARRDPRNLKLVMFYEFHSPQSLTTSTHQIWIRMGRLGSPIG